jgi:SAM-dependent methyltransferase
VIGRWRFARLVGILQPPNSLPLRRWIALQGGKLSGRVVNVGCGSDQTDYGDRTVRVDAFAPRPTVRADLGYALPLASEAFDGAVCTEVLEHVPDGVALLREIRRVLKPGATLIVTVPFVFPYHLDPGDRRRWTPAGLGEDLEREGFEVVFLSGIGGRATSAWLMLESLHPVVKASMRLLLLPFRFLAITPPPRHGVWSRWALHAVAVARARPSALDGGL